ncbi:MAG TPA: TadE/TadG family type IV pilus assembly protein [Actinomycetota bacterium]
MRPSTTGRAINPQRGAATVEAAFALPIFLALVGCVAFAGWLGAMQTVLTHGTREGARLAAIPASEDLRVYPDQDAVRDAVEDATPLLSPTDVRLIEEPGARNAPLRVEATYDVANPVAVLLAPLRAIGIAGDIPARITLRASAEVRRE